ncbi:protein mono-ADP-ribosyltransferase PARP9-like [Acanthopagrus latus]|nr:protein mono-ADP-ribosyltransferase PARP9-like [Acanthopagrus latus]
MEKSQWDLKKIRFQQKRLTRLDDFVHTYKVMHEGLLREYQDSLKIKTKTHRVAVERWKQRKQGRRGVYVSPMKKPFDFKKHEKQKVLKTKTSNQTEVQEKFINTNEPTNKTDVDTLLEDAPPPPPMLDTHQDKRLSVTLSEDLTVCVWKADLTMFDVDAVVNAANTILSHSGGLALALVKAGGPDIVEESDLHIRKCGKLKPGQAVVTSAGNLPCRYVIHAVGPKVTINPPPTMLSKGKGTLKKAIESILQKVRDLNIQSVAIPAISSGIFNFPLGLCADRIVSTIKEVHDHKKLKTQHRVVHLVNNDEPSVKEMERACLEILVSPTSEATVSEQMPKSKTITDEEQQLKTLWKRKDTEVVVAVIPSANQEGSSFLVHHSELCSLRPH